MLTDDKDRVVTASIPIPESPGKIFECQEIPDAPELEEWEMPIEKTTKPKTKLLKHIVALIIFITTILWTISEDVVKEKLNPFISSFLDRVVAKYPINNDNADHSHSNAIEVTGAVEASKNSNRVSAHDGDPDK